MDAADVITAPAIAGIVYLILASLADAIPKRWKPPIALLLGVAWAAVGFVWLDAYANVLIAIFTGITAGAAASGIDSYRYTYSTTDAPPPPPPPSID